MRKLLFYTLDGQFAPVPLAIAASGAIENDQHSRWLNLSEKVAVVAKSCGFERDKQPHVVADDKTAFSPALIVLFLPSAALGQAAFFDELPDSCIRPIRTLKDRDREMDMRYQPVVTISIPDIMDLYSETQNLERHEKGAKKYFFDLRPDARFKFLDSSIWHRYVPLSLRNPEDSFEGMLREVLLEISHHWNDGLYRTNAAIATLEFQLRMLQHSYIAKTGIGGHAVAVKPFKFHSETWMKRKAAEEIEFFTDPVWEGGDLIGQLRWRTLIVDDYAERKISCVEGSDCKTNKRDLIIRPIKYIYDAKLKKTDCRVPANSRGLKKIIGDRFLTDSADDKPDDSLLSNAKKRLRSTAYDIIFLDYLLDYHGEGDGQREYGHDLMLELIHNDREISSDGSHSFFRRDYMGRYWIFPVSSFPFAFPDKLNQLGISHLHEIWHLSSGGDPIATPQLFAYYLYRFMKQKVAKYFLYPEALRRFLNEAPVNTKGSNNRKFWTEFLLTAVKARREQDSLLDKYGFDGSSSPFIQSIKDLIGSQKKLKEILSSIEKILNLLSCDTPPLIGVFEEKCLDLFTIDPNYQKVLALFTAKARSLARKEYDEALAKIEEDKDSNQFEFIGRNLRELPPEISKMANLQRLYLSGNHLTFFPSSLFSLQKLVEIDLKNNKIQDISSVDFQSMSKLKRLNLTGNPLLNRSIEAEEGFSFYETLQKALIPLNVGAASGRRIFISYAHEDIDSKNTLIQKLDTFQLNSDSSAWQVWHDGTIRAGEGWDARIKENLMAAHVILFLASDHMLTSKYIRDVELKTAIERQKEPESTRPHIVPVVLEKCNWESVLGQFLAATPNGKPVKSYKVHNDGWHEVATSVVKLLM
ncbi:MAG: TIR domain-containing protein [Saprospiraceae bacterium]